jgi:hypothetical protein
MQHISNLNLNLNTGLSISISTSRTTPGNTYDTNENDVYFTTSDMLTFFRASACCDLFKFNFRQIDNTDVASIVPCSNKRRVAHPDENWGGIKKQGLTETYSLTLP